MTKKFLVMFMTFIILGTSSIAMAEVLYATKDGAIMQAGRDILTTIGEIAPATAVEVLERDGERIRVRLEGWVHESRLTDDQDFVKGEMKARNRALMDQLTADSEYFSQKIRARRKNIAPVDEAEFNYTNMFAQDYYGYVQVIGDVSNVGERDFDYTYHMLEAYDEGENLIARCGISIESISSGQTRPFSVVLDARSGTVEADNLKIKFEFGL